MPWVRVVTGWSNNGPIYKTVWVAPAKKAKRAVKKRASSNARNAARRAAQREAAARAAKVAAQRAAVAKARQRELAVARNAAYEALKQRQKALVLRTGILKDTRARISKPVVRPPAGPGGSLLQQRQADKARAIAEANAEKARAEAASRKSIQDRNDNYVRFARQQALLKNAKSGDPRFAREVERELAREALRNRNTGQINTKFLQEIMKLYDEHAKQSYTKYESQVAKLNAALDSGNIERARRIFFSSAFKSSQKEFIRLFGKGKNPMEDGAYGKFQKQLDDIAVAQREWWKKQMRAALETELQRAMGDDKIAIRERIKAQLDALDGKTGLVQTSDGRWRHRTMEEELEHQRALLLMQQEKLIAERNRRDIAVKRDMLIHGRVDYNGQSVYKRDVPFIQTSENIIRMKYGGQAPDFRDRQNVDKFAEDMLDEWDRGHPAPPRGYTRFQTQAYRDWVEARQKHRDDIYKYLGTTAPTFFDTVLSAPVVSHAMALFQGGASAIGAGKRIILKSLTGQSKIFVAQYSDLPGDVKEKLGLGGPVAGLFDLANAVNPLSQTTPFGNAQMQAVLNSWLQTPEGQRWWKKQEEKAKTDASEEDKAFLQNFYGAADPGQKLDALNQYGSYPTSSDASNLLFQLIADPTNAIPLKFTTWFARGKYAREMVEGVQALRKPWVASRSFVGVDEGTLRLRKFGEKVADDIERRGVNLDEVIQKFREDIVGIKDPAKARPRVEAFMRSIGLNPREISESQLFNVIEDVITNRVKREGKLLTQADELNAETLSKLAEADEALKKLKQTNRAEAQKVKKPIEKKFERGKQAQAVLAEKRSAQEQALRARAARAPKPEPVVAPDAPIRRQQTERVARRVRSVLRPEARYTSADEFYTVDRVGNRIPKKFEKDPGYVVLEHEALKGDKDAIAKLQQLSRRARNLDQMAREDRPFFDSRRRVAAPTEAILLERAGVGPEAAKRLNQDRRTIRFLRRRAASNNVADDLTRTFTRRGREIIQGEGRGGGVGLEDEFGDLRGQVVGDRIAIGDDIIEARENTIAGTKGLYETFTHDATKHYPGLDGVDVTKMTPFQMKRLIRSLDKAPIGSASYRDGGQLLFELFHQLRLNKKFDLLDEMSDYMTALIDEDPSSIWPWMWKTMEERAGMGSFDLDVLRNGFYDAAEAFNLHPELAWAAIPNGYYAKRPPLFFGLSPKLEGFADKASDIFHYAPRGYNDTKARSELTRIFMGATGEPTRVLSYVAERYGDFFKGGAISVRMRDELAHAVALKIGPKEFSNLMMRYNRLIDPKLIEQASNAGEPLLDIMDRLVGHNVKTYGRVVTGRRPEYAWARQAIEQAYQDGALPALNGKAHTMMFLSRVQTNPDAYLGAIRTYLGYMKNLSPEDYAYAKRVVGEMYEGEILTDVTRHVARRPNFRDAYTGVRLTGDGADRLSIWREHGLAPDAARIEAYARERASRADALERQLEVESERASWLREESSMPSNDYTGTIDTTGFQANVRSLVDDLRKYSDDPLKTARLTASLEGTVRNFMNRMADTGAASMDQVSLDELRDALREVSKIAEVKRVVVRLQDELGFVRLGEKLNAAVEPLAWREASLHADLKMLLNEDGVIRPGASQAKVDAIQAELAQLATVRRSLGAGRKPRFERLRDDYVAQIDDATQLGEKVNPIPDSPAATSGSYATSRMYDHIFEMSEQQWWAHEKQRANRVLQSATATRARKMEARRHIKDIEAAEYAVEIEKSRGTYVPWQERAAFTKRVERLFGEQAEQYVAPRMVAPMAQSANDIVVEEARVYWRLLQQAAQGPAFSKHRSVTIKGEKMDFIPKDVWDEVEQRVADAIAEARGWRASTKTKGRRRGKNEESQKPLGRMSDNDPLIIEAKTRALRTYAKETGTVIPVEAYDEVRQVLWKGYVGSRNAKWLLKKAKRRAAQTKEPLDTVYLALRAAEAKKEARRQLRGLAGKEMYGHSPESIMAEFMARYTDDGTIRHFTPELTPLQRSTLEAHVKHLSGLDTLDSRIGAFLQSANRPPLGSRAATREFLMRIGAWSPRRAEDFARGLKSWSVYDEADYWRTAYGEVPDWANVSKLRSEFNRIFHDEDLYFRQMRAWGIFSSGDELKLRLAGHSAREIEKAALEGNLELGVKARRELALQRKYVIERYGSLVSKDGETLDAMPWLMTPEEYKTYVASQMGRSLPEGMVQSAEEMDEMVQLIEQAMEQFWEKYIGAGLRDAGQVSYHDVFKMASEVQALMLAKPKWAARRRDLFGNALNIWAWFNRWLIFSNPSFLVTNVVDAPIKTAYYAITRRGLFNPGLAGVPDELVERARALTPDNIGLDATTAMYRVKQASPLSRITNPRGYTRMERAIDRGLAVVDGTGQVFPTAAGHVELAMKMRLAQGMYPQVYSHLLKTLKDPELAEVAARKFIKEEVGHMWPHAGDGPFEKLWNRIVPFSSYSVRNKVMFIAEAFAHPIVLNYINRIGAYIEQENLEEWEKRHPGIEMPEYLRRRISLPWAPDYYLDLSTFSDAARGFKPIFDATKPQTVEAIAAQWVRVVNPSTQAGAYALFNAFNVLQKTMWQNRLNADGFPTGQYSRITTGWTEPWSDDAPGWGSVFWFMDAFEKYEELIPGGLTPGETSQLVGQVLFFNGIATFDRGTTLNSLYFGLKDKNAEAAKKWLETPDGQYLQDWWEANALDPMEVRNKLKDLQRGGAPWFFKQTKDFQERVKLGRQRISDIRDAFAAELSRLEYGSNEYRETKARMYMAINNVYLNFPELMQSTVWSKTPAEWSSQLEDWETDKLMDDFMALSSKRPSRLDYKSTRAWDKAVDEWEHEKQEFLARHPQVAKRLNAGRTELARVRIQQDKEWDRILDRIAKRKDKIEQAKEIIADAGRDSKAGRNAQERLDALYLANELDFSLLERDNVAHYFDDSDYNKLPPGQVGPPTLRGNLLQRSTLLLDFDRLRYEKAKREGRGPQFLADLKYNQRLQAAILKAKGGSPFGKFDPLRFVKAVKSDAWLRSQYFEKNPGKREKWAKTDAYIRHISVWGKLAAAGRWDEANAAWDALPDWVKERYYEKHPEKRRRAQQTSAYLGYMQKWVNMFEAGDSDAAMKYFNSLPDWAKERYYQKHPENRAKFELNAKVGAQLAEYFAGDAEMRARYLKLHPDLARWLAKNATGKDIERVLVMEAYRNIPKGEAWLRRVYREKYPQYFSQEAAGERRLNRVYDTLAKHPDVLPEFEQWVKSIWDSYAEMLKKGASRPMDSYYEPMRDVPARAYKRSLSAEEASRIGRARARSSRNIPK